MFEKTPVEGVLAEKPTFDFNAHWRQTQPAHLEYAAEEEESAALEHGSGRRHFNTTRETPNMPVIRWLAAKPLIYFHCEETFCRTLKLS